jgi:COPI associated protein
MAAAAPAIEKAGAGIGHYLWVCLKAIGRFFMWCFSLVQKCLTRLPIKWASLLLRVLNLGNAVLLAAACVFIFMKASNAGVNLSVTQVFLSVYIGVFALLLGAFEMRVKWTEGSIRRNFGFMFTYMGRALFLIFLSAVCFGMLNSDQVRLDLPVLSCLLLGR